MSAAKKTRKPYYALKNYFRNNKITYEEIAGVLGISPNAVQLKLNGDSDFFISEMKVLCAYYNLSIDIFFEDEVA